MSTSLSPNTDLQNKQPNKLKNFQKKFLMFLLLFFLSIILFFSFFSDNALKLYEKYFVNNHQEVVTYLEKISLYNNVSTEILNSIRVKFNTLNEGEFNKEIETEQKELQQLINQTITLTPPQGFKQHKDAFLAVLEQRLYILSVYNKTRKTYVFHELKISTDELSQRQDQERIALLKAFKNEKIEYKKVGNGSIRYWFKGHSAISLERSM